jgi:4-diphosphocytidyl-2-C-methyl-D-erythritol kinase
MVSFPPCKINLGLRIINKRPDGYHDLETCYYPVPWTDILEVIRAEDFSFTSSGNPVPGVAGENLCVKAYRILQQDFNLKPVRIHLHKIIPTGAGLGGGSSDAAHTLRLLNEIFRLGLSQEAMMSYAATLGSDCAYFVQDDPMIGSGRGEVLNNLPISLKGQFLFLLNPGIHVSTAEAFRGIRPQRQGSSLQQMVLGERTHWKESLVNDFEVSIFQHYPALAKAKAAMYAAGAWYASLSGSGATVFGLFDRKVKVVHPFPKATEWSSFLA